MLTSFSSLKLSTRPLACTLAVGLFAWGALAQAGEIRWRPVAATGNVISLPDPSDPNDTEIVLSDGGVTVTLFLEVSGWDPLTVGQLLGAFQGTVDSSTYAGGIPGNPGTFAGLDLVPVGYPEVRYEGAFQAMKTCSSVECVTDPPNCVWDPLSDCGSNPGSTSCPPELPACLDRPDYVFAGLADIPQVVTEGLDYTWLAVSADCKDDPDGGATKFYGGTLLLEVPLAAVGTYNVSFVDDINFTMLNACAGPVMPGSVLTPGVITILADTDRCCYGIGGNSPGCEEGITREECRTRPLPIRWGAGMICAQGCPECVGAFQCEDPTQAQPPDADNLCTDNTCEGGACVFTENYDAGVYCCDPNVGPPDGLTTIDDGEICSADTCDADTGVVTHEGGDCDEDGVCDSEDNCPTAANADQTDSDGDTYGDACDGPFDADHDGDIDLSDVVSFVGCMGGPAVAATVDCADVHDSNGDSHVDLMDLAALQEVFTGTVALPCD